MMKKIFLKLLFFAFAILSMNLHASHYQGLDIFYDCLGNNQYKITIKTYRDCGSTVIISLPGTVSGLEINFQSSTCLQPTLVTPWSEVSLKEVSLFCGNIQTKCSNPLATLNGVQEQVFEAVYDFTGLNCPIVFSASQCCRNSIITNITQPGVRFIYSEITINNSLTNCNSSPRFENLPVNYVCLGNYFAFKQKAIDPDGDSLVYRLSNCLGGTSNANDTVAYVTPQSAQQPILSNPPLIINPSTGDITFTPSSIQVSVLCLFVDEYRNGVLIGTIERDIQIGVINCTEFIPMSVNCTFYNDFNVSCVKDSIEKL